MDKKKNDYFEQLKSVENTLPKNIKFQWMIQITKGVYVGFTHGEPEPPTKTYLFNSVDDMFAKQEFIDKIIDGYLWSTLNLDNVFAFSAFMQIADGNNSTNFGEKNFTDTDFFKKEFKRKKELQNK